MSEVRSEPGSFRDRHGRVFYKDGAVYRALSRHSLTAWHTLEKTRFFPRLVEEGLIVKTGLADAAALASSEALPGDWAGILRHETIPYVSYPYEWSFQMLQEAALLQLRLISESLAEGMILKDATPYNVQWNGVRTVFIDIPSFEPWPPGGAWTGYRQFCSLYLYPLMLQAYRNLPFQPWLRGSLDGISPRECRDLLSSRDLFRSGVLLHVWLQSRFQEKYGARRESASQLLKDAGFNRKAILSNVGRLTRLVSRLRWTPSASQWTGYAGDNTYSRPDREAKREFVRWAVGRKRWKMSWDLGANTGDYSRLAAAGSDTVLAMDRDSASVDLLYRDLRREGPANILPLVVNLADPSPSLGWRCLERTSLTERGSPELVLCLALIHHMVIDANIPLAEFVQWLSRLGGSLVIEFVRRDDPMVKMLLRNKEDQYTDYRMDYFEDCLGKCFRVHRRQELPSGSRVLYFAEA